MASGWTNRGLYRQKKAMCHADAYPTTFKLHLVTDATEPTADTNTLSDLTEIATGNGYSGGITVNRNSTDFDTVTESDADDWAFSQLKDYTVSASGGTIPPSGDGISFVVLTDDHATPGSREVWAYWDVRVGGTTPRTISDGNGIRFEDLELRGVN